MAYLVGILNTSFAETASRLIGAAVTQVLVWVGWQRAARRKRHALQLALTEAAAVPAKQQQRPLDAKGFLDVINANRRVFGTWIRRTPAVDKIVAKTAPAGQIPFALRVLEEAFARGVDRELRRRNLDVASSEVSGFLDDLEHQLRHYELAPDPLDALRALDEELFQYFDRERAERAFRIGVMPPMIAVAMYVA